MNPRQFTITIAVFSDDMIDACRVREHIADAVALRGSVAGELVYVGSVLEHPEGLEEAQPVEEAKI